MSGYVHKGYESLPSIGFGTGELKGEVARLAVAEALRAGFRLVDTGAIYDNEQEVGHAIRESNVPREDIFVITKGAHDDDEHGYGKARESFDQSLGRLGLGYVDSYLIHWPTGGQKRRETWRVLEDIHAEGGARSIGVSNYAVRHLEELLDYAEVQPAMNQIEFHPYIYNEQQEVVEFCKEHDIDVVGYSTFAGGQGDRDAVVMDIASRHGKSARQVLARWVLQHGVVPLVRSKNAMHIAESRQIDDFVLEAKEMEMLNERRGRRLFPNPNDLA